MSLAEGPKGPEASADPSLGRARSQMSGPWGLGCSTADTGCWWAGPFPIMTGCGPWGSCGWWWPPGEWSWFLGWLSVGPDGFGAGIGSHVGKARPGIPRADVGLLVGGVGF